MMIVQFKGGLGNQMFQYAFLKLLQKQYPDVSVKADLRHYVLCEDHAGFILEENYPSVKLDKARGWEIFRITGQIPYPECIRKKDKVWKKVIFRMVLRINKCLKYGTTHEKSVKVENLTKGYQIDSTLFHLDSHKSWYLSGYWQNYDFSSLYTELRREFYPVHYFNNQNKEMYQFIRENEAVSIHIRGGDYRGSVYDVLSAEYYKKATELIEKSVENPVYIIFTDDREYVEESFAPLRKKAKIVDWNQGRESCMDIFLMSQCRHNIIANSSFSYWAAVLNENPEKIMIRPFMQMKERESWENSAFIRLDNQTGAIVSNNKNASGDKDGEK